MTREVVASSWQDALDHLYADSWQPQLQRFRSPLAFRGVARAQHALRSGLSRIGQDPAAMERHLLRNFIKYAEARPGGPLNVRMSVDGQSVGETVVPVSAPLLFTANDCLDIGTCLGSPVSLDYFDRAPFPFDGSIDRMTVEYT